MEKGKTGSIKMPNNFDTDDGRMFTKVLLLAEDHAKLCAEVDYLQNGICSVKSKKIYFAGPWFDERALKLYETCKNIYETCELSTIYDIYYPMDEENTTPLDAFDKNIKHLNECDTVVALVSRKDVGTAWEIGMAYALHKKIILLGYDASTFLSHTNVMLAFTGECITIDQYSRLLCSNTYETVQINNNWEGIE